ncbi:ER degradation-enhancing alpha-mannosidase-like protein 3 [Clavelina lepadiformis]|uniref:ER degradation-enhancing alpha-mannosidase-like protein 3 n=1 Tax=Clavelina lepadiformis TaxID=159417 RepID=UPI0040437FA7
MENFPICQLWRRKRTLLWFVAIIAILSPVWGPKNITTSSRLELRDKVVEMFNHAYGAYMRNAYPADELMPIACKGRVRGITPSRGDVDDALGNFSLTLVDTLDTLAVLGLYDEFEDAVRKVERDVNFNADLSISVFETNIRMLGGLLGGHSAALEIQERHNRMKWYNGSLLTLAKELGDRLLPAFNTTSGMPLSRINLLTGAVRKERDRDTCTACAGTMILEMAALSRYTGDPIYETRARAAMDYLWSRRQRSSDLMGTVLNVENGNWVRKESGIGAGIDSYYEYLLKAYIFLGDETFLERFNTHYQAIKQYCAQGPLVVDVLMHKPTTSARNFVDALSAFWPGLQVLKGDVKSAIETHELLYQVFTRHTFLPEAFTTNFDIHWGQYPLRPEFAESTYLLYKATKDPYYLEVGKTIIENLEKKARVKCGFAGIKDVRTFTHEDRMDSYFLAEMFKYLYLLFAPESEPLGIDIEDYILTTEAHILPLKLSLRTPPNSTFEEVTSPVNAPENFERSCVNSAYVRTNSLKTIQELREKTQNHINKIKSFNPGQCRNTQTETRMTWNGKRQLLAKEFTPGNQQHTDILRKMGIKILMLEDGKVQLMQEQNSAVSVKDATEGALFMQEMIELSKMEKSEVANKPVHVQLISHPFLGSLAFRGGPAQFGPRLENIEGVEGEVEIADPYDACVPLGNAESVQGKIVLAQRGQCMFVQKAKRIEEAGGIGVIIIDNAVSSFETSSPFAMAGDEKTETSIPAVFLFSHEGNMLRDAAIEQAIKEQPLKVMLANKLKPLNELLLKDHLSMKNTSPVKAQVYADSTNDPDTTKKNKKPPIYRPGMELSGSESKQTEKNNNQKTSSVQRPKQAKGEECKTELSESDKRDEL